MNFKLGLKFTIFKNCYNVQIDLHRALARISELGVQKYTFWVNWVSNSFSSIALYTENMDIRVSKISNRVSKRHPDALLAKGLDLHV